jgi:hypothetical protein
VAAEVNLIKIETIKPSEALRRMDKALQDRFNLTKLDRLLTSDLKELPGMLQAMAANDLSDALELVLVLGVIDAPLQVGQGQKNNGIPLFDGFDRLNPEIGQAQALLKGKVINFNGPAVLIESQASFGREAQVSTDKVLGALVPRVPFANEDTDLERQVFELTLHGADQIGPKLLVCSGQRESLIPLVLKVPVPFRELFPVQLPIGLDGGDNVPALSPTEFQQFVGGIPTITQ